MLISYDPDKRERTIDLRGLDFEDAPLVFGGVTASHTDDRIDYGEVRTITVGTLRGTLIVMVWTQRGRARHIISMREADDREQDEFRKRLRKARRGRDRARRR